MSAQILHHKDEYISTSSSKTQGETIPCILKLEAEYGELIISLHQPPSINLKFNSTKTPCITCGK